MGRIIQLVIRHEIEKDRLQEAYLFKACSVFLGCKLSRHFSFCQIQIIRFYPCSVFIRGCIGMNRDKKVCTNLVGDCSPFLKFQKNVCRPRQNDIQTKFLLQFSGKLQSYIKNHIFFPCPSWSDGSRIMAAMTGVNNNSPDFTDYRPYGGWAFFINPFQFGRGCKCSYFISPWPGYLLPPFTLDIDNYPKWLGKCKYLVIFDAVNIKNHPYRIWSVLPYPGSLKKPISDLNIFYAGAKPPF